MRVSHVTIARVQAGQLEAATGMAGEAAKLIGRHGGDVRFFLAGAAGEDVNTTAFSIEYGSSEELGRAFDELGSDMELQAFTTRVNAPDSPSELRSQMMMMEVPIRQTSRPGRGSILEIHTTRVTPGRLEEALGESVEVCDFVESAGALNARLIMATYAGLASGLYSLVWEHENMRAQVRVAEAWSSPKGLEIQARSLSASPSSTRVSSALYNEVPL